MEVGRTRILTLCGCLLAIGAGSVDADILYSCERGNSMDGVHRGFYVPEYKGLTLGTVSLAYSTTGQVGDYTVSLTAHAGTYDGPIIGSVERMFDQEGGEVVFDFGDAEVTEGQTIAFVQDLVSAPADAFAYYDVGTCGIDEICIECSSIVETVGTEPPLSQFRRASVGATIEGRASTPVERRTWGTVRSLFR